MKALFLKAKARGWKYMAAVLALWVVKDLTLYVGIPYLIAHATG